MTGILRTVPSVYASIFCVIVAGVASGQEASSPKTMPIPPDLAPQVQQSIDLGRELYLVDNASAIGTDALQKNLGSLKGKALVGYLSLREGDKDGKPLTPWLVVFFTDTADPKIAYRVHVPMKPEAPRSRRYRLRNGLIHRY